MPAGSFETLHIVTRTEWTIYGLPFSFHQNTWLDEKGLPIQRSFQIYVLGNPLEASIMELLLPTVADEPYLAIMPDHGDPAGGTQIIIVGDGFTKETTVKFGTKEIPKEKIQFNEDTNLLTTWTLPIEETVQAGEKIVQILK